MNFGTRRAMARLADERGHFRMLAVDQRPPVQRLVAEALGVDEAPIDAVREVKQLLVRTLAPYASAVLVDPVTSFATSDLISPRQGMIMTLESSAFDAGPHGRMTSPITDWSVDKIKRIGADGVKFLAWYRGDAGPEVIEHQQQVVAEAGEACRRLDIPFILELLLYPFPGEVLDDTLSTQRRTEMCIESVETFARREFDVDLFMLESPLPDAVLGVDETDDDALQGPFDLLHHAAGRPWVLLSGASTSTAFARMLTLAYQAGASGYLAGRSVWWHALDDYPDLTRVEERLSRNGLASMHRINDLTDDLAVAWDAVPSTAAAVPLPPSWDDVPGRYAGALM